MKLGRKIYLKFRTLLSIYFGFPKVIDCSKLNVKDLWSLHHHCYLPETYLAPYPGSPPKLFLGKIILKICSKYTGEHPYRSVILIKLLCNFTEITLRHGFFSVELLNILRTPFHKGTYGGLLLTLSNIYDGNRF